MSEGSRGGVGAGLDPLLHEPARLSILAALSPADYVEFSTLLGLTGLSKSALSKQVSALADAGVVEVTASPVDKRVRRIALSESGREAFDSYLRRLEEIVRLGRAGSDRSRPAPPASQS